MDPEKNRLYYGDNLDIMRHHIKDQSVDLVYLDPPFNSNADYNVLFAEHASSAGSDKSQAQIKAFKDTWQWDTEAARNLMDAVQHGGEHVAKCMLAFKTFLGQTDMLAYLSMMAPRLVELRRVLKPNGSIYLHCDPTASHYLKMLMDAVFTPQNFLNEIIWKRTHAHGGAKRYGPVHDSILFYSCSQDYLWVPTFTAYTEEYTEGFFKFKDENGRRYRATILTGTGTRTGSSGKPWRGIDPTAIGRHWAIPGYVRQFFKNPKVATAQDALDELESLNRIIWPKKVGGSPAFKQYLDDMEGVPVQDVWVDIPPISAQAQERLGYPTQKPEALLERILKASSLEGDTILDPFCGCGTTTAAAQKLNRRWIGIDITHLAVNLIKIRLADSFGKNIANTYQIIGEPRDLESARALADADKYQFQYWALGLVGARPVASQEKKGADKGIDGRTYLIDADGEYKSIIISVKGGHVTVSQLRDLRGVIERDDAAIGVLITLEEPTAPMRKEAADAGFYENRKGSNVGASRHPRLQLITIRELLAGKRLDLPVQQDVRAFKQAPKARKKSADASLPFES